MIIYLYGPDSYRRNAKLREVVGQYRKKYSQADFLDVDLEERSDDWVVVRDFLEQPSLFVRSKLLVIRGSDAISEKRGFSKGQIKELVELLQSYIESSKIFLVISDFSSPKKNFRFLLKKPVRVQEFERLEGRKLEAFVLHEAKERGVNFEQDAKRFFLEYVLSLSDTSWTAVQELEKISLARFSQPVSLLDLQKIISWQAYDESFRIALSLIRSDSGVSRLGFLEELQMRGDDARYTLNLLGSLVRGEGAVEFAEYDEKIKGGELDDEVALTGFALGVE
jgi:DNA polymerase III delta subunit